MKICQVCHRTDAFGPIQHDKGWHENIAARTEYEEKICQSNKPSPSGQTGRFVRNWVKKPLGSKTFASLAALK